MKNLYLCSFLILVYCSCKQPTASSGIRIVSADYKKAIQFRNNKETDSAFLYFNLAKDNFLQHGDSLGVGKCLINMALISTDHGDNFGGQELSLSAIPYFSEDSASHYPYLCSNYNNLGIASFQLKEYDKAIEFYQKTLQFTSDSLAALVTKNNLANAYQKLGDYARALSVYDAILSHDDMFALDYARVLSNHAYTLWLQNQNSNVEADLLKALHIREKGNDSYGISASYGYLSDVYLHSKPDSSLYYAQKMDAFTQALQLPDDRLDALQKLIKLSPPEKSKEYFEAYQHLSDSIQNARSAAKNQFALIRYETEKHKSDKLRFQAESTRRQTWIFALTLLIFFIIVISIFWYRKRKQRIQLEAQHEIRTNQLKISKKVHDIVANGLYRVLSKIEHTTKLNREELLDDIDFLYEQSRDISYENEDSLGVIEDFKLVMAKLLGSFGSESTKIIITGNTTAFWEQIPVKIRFELLQVLQELMVNMKKHSHATHVVIRFEQTNRLIKIFYKDNGKGLSLGYKQGNGLRHTGNRINEIAGVINFVNGAKSGLEVSIEVPLPN